MKFQKSIVPAWNLNIRRGSSMRIWKYGECYALSSGWHSRNFFVNRNQEIDLLLQDHSEIKINERENKFLAVLQIVRQLFRYNVRSLGNHKRWKNLDLKRNVLKYIEIYGYNTMSTHTVCVYNGIIYDGTFQHAIKLTKESLK